MDLISCIAAMISIDIWMFLLEKRLEQPQKLYVCIFVEQHAEGGRHQAHGYFRCVLLVCIYTS